MGEVGAPKSVARSMVVLGSSTRASNSDSAGRSWLARSRLRRREAGMGDGRLSGWGFGGTGFWGLSGNGGLAAGAAREREREPWRSRCWDEVDAARGLEPRWAVSLLVL